MKKISGKQILDKNPTEKFFNRELSLIEFNKRVLAEAEGNQHPLLERLKFIAILSSNFDEFFMIRVAGLKRQVAAGLVELSFDGMTPQEQLSEIRKRMIPLYQKQEDILLNDIIPALEKEDIFIDDYDKLSKEDKKYLSEYFNECILPVLTPLSLDPAHPFPRLINRSLNIAFLIIDDTKKIPEKKVAFLQVPSILPRLVKLEKNDKHHFILVEQVISANANELFPGLKIETTNTFRMTRDADFEIAEDEAEDLLTEIAEHLKIIRWGSAAVKLEVCSNMNEEMVEFLRKSLSLEYNDIYVHKRPLNISDFLELLKIDKRDLKDKPFQTRVLPEFRGEGISAFDVIRNKDILVHHPFDSFTNSVLKLLNEASEDPNVLTIKITLYRVGMNSPVVTALKRAAENGKNVTAFVELKARFDEENNIIWAKELEQVGVHVVYGVLGLKTHCKVVIIVRKEGNKLNTYLHLATGNYNHGTSRLYTDIGLFTSNRDFSREAIYLFNYLTGYSYLKEWNNFFVAPFNLRRSIIELINRETELHSDKNPGLIIAKMNSLAHSEVINTLYRASRRGVQIKLLVRGVCCLKPGIPGLSENIEVRSVLGRFLEHSRTFYFKNSGKAEYYLSSADWMTRNLHKRVEIMFPVNAPALQTRIKNLLDIYWKDNTKSWKLMPDGSHKKIKPDDGEKPFCAQEFFLNEIKKSIKKSKREISPYI
ncbi:polyphosphate kinase 1 [Bacteroidota bacterium]